MTTQETVAPVNVQTESLEASKPSDTQVAQQPKFNFETTPYSDAYRIIGGSPVQLIKGLQAMNLRVSADKETDDYKKSLYPKMRNISQQVETKFMALMKGDDATQESVYNYNLCGFYGQVRRVRGRFPFVKGIKPQTKYAYANFGNFLKMLRHRMNHLASKSLPSPYFNDEVFKKGFEELQKRSANFVKFLDDTVSQQWDEAVMEAREKAGVVKKTSDRREDYDEEEEEERKKAPKKVSVRNSNNNFNKNPRGGRQNNSYGYYDERPRPNRRRNDYNNENYQGYSQNREYRNNYNSRPNYEGYDDGYRGNSQKVYERTSYSQGNRNRYDDEQSYGQYNVRREGSSQRYPNNGYRGRQSPRGGRGNRGGRGRDYEANRAERS